VNGSALDLVEQITAMNRGRYLEDLVEATPTAFCIGVAAFPEKHAEAPNLEWDLDLLLRKQRAGAEYAVTQLFYDNESYLRYVKMARDLGVTIPIIPGLKILTRREQLTLVPRNFNVEVPRALVEEVMAVPPEAAVERGVAWAARQTLQLFEAGVPSVHIYVMQNTRPFVTLMEQLKPQL
jgi:methylenetetrahydrofolate reductase (NADPH)